MKRTLSLVLVILVSLTLTSCGTLFVKGGSEYRQGMSAFEQKAYVQALDSLLRAWTMNPDFTEAKAMIPVAFNDGDAQYKQAALAAPGDDPEVLDRIAQAYTDLEALHRLARESGYPTLAASNYSEEAKQANQKAAQRWFNLARNQQQGGDKLDIRAAVMMYERAKARDPQNPEIIASLQKAVDEATVTLMVLGIGSPSFRQTMYSDIREGLKADRFVKVIEAGNLSNREGFFGPTDLAVDYARHNDVDYVLEVYGTTQVRPINTEQQVYLPSSSPRFSGVKKTIGYSEQEQYSYRLFDVASLRVIKEDSHALSKGPYTYTVSYVPAEGVRTLHLQGEPKENLRYVTSSLDLHSTNAVVNTLRKDYYNIPVPMEVANPKDLTQWLAYYRNTYTDFATFANEHSNQELFYAIEVAHIRGTEDYVILGNSVFEAKEESARNSAIFNAQVRRALDMVKEESEKTKEPTYRYGVDIAKAIGSLL
jgi:tetratricopeptide (TPR) repeat protein